MTISRSLAISASALLAAGLLAGCSSDSDDSGDATGDWAVNNCSIVTEPTIEASAPEGSTIEGPVAVSGAADAVPVVSVAAGAAPATSLQTVDLIEGEGTPVAAGDEVAVNYCGVGMETRSIFDSSWARGEPITFPLAGVIAGWQEGMPGMKPGGRRLLIIPADLAYGQTPPSPDILPGETLIFVVDLLASAS